MKTQKTKKGQKEIFSKKEKRILLSAMNEIAEEELKEVSE